jgi:hypothetical protein
VSARAGEGRQAWDELGCAAGRKARLVLTECSCASRLLVTRRQTCPCVAPTLRQHSVAGTARGVSLSADLSDLVTRRTAALGLQRHALAQRPAARPGANTRRASRREPLAGALFTLPCLARRGASSRCGNRAGAA